MIPPYGLGRLPRGNRAITFPRDNEIDLTPAARHCQGGDPVHYINSFDGKVLTEYDDDGDCLSDYIYTESRLVAKHRHEEV